MRRAATCLLLLVAVLGASAGLLRALPGAPSSPPQTPEYELKAAYLFNFVKFVEWPETTFATADSPIRLCVYGSDPFDRALATIDGKTVRDRRLVAEQVRRAPQIDECHVLFVPRREFRSKSALLERVAGKGVLSVTEVEDDDPARGIINLVRRDGRVVIQVAAGRASASGLRISSRLLQLAEVVDDAEVGAR